jgi:oligoribonuclease (3'-5' exoribonuclease)
MTLRIIDIETTGTDPESHSVIEIASADVLADGTISPARPTLARCHHPSRAMFPHKHRHDRAAPSTRSR